MLLNCGLGEDLRVPCREIQPVNPKGNQSSMFIGRIDVEGATPIHWPPDGLIGKYPDAGKDWSLSKLQELVMDRDAAVLGIAKSWTKRLNWSLLKLMSIESVMPSNHLILHCSLLFLPSIFPRWISFQCSHAQEAHIYLWGSWSECICHPLGFSCS